MQLILEKTFLVLDILLSLVLLLMNKKYIVVFQQFFFRNNETPGLFYDIQLSYITFLLFLKRWIWHCDAVVKSAVCCACILQGCCFHLLCWIHLPANDLEKAVEMGPAFHSFLFAWKT